MTQNEKYIRDASKELGADFFELFTAMIVNRPWNEVMDKQKENSMQGRLGAQTGEGSKKKLQ